MGRGLGPGDMEQGADGMMRQGRTRGALVRAGAWRGGLGAALRAVAQALWCVGLAALLWPSLTVAEPLPAPQGPVVLTVSGAIAVTNVGPEAQFDMAMLQALPQSEFATSTLWTDGVQTFRGVALADLLARLGVTSGHLQAEALNDYSVDIPVSDAVTGGPIIAYAVNDAPLSVRDKGPLWVVYPFDKGADYSSEVIYARSIWQLAKITVLP